MQRKLAIALTSGLMLSTCLAAPARAQDIGGIISMFMHAGPHYGYSHHRHYGYGYGYAPRRHYGYGIMATGIPIATPMAMGMERGGTCTCRRSAISRSPMRP